MYIYQSINIFYRELSFFLTGFSIRRAIDQIKTCVDLKSLVESRGVTLTKNGKEHFYG